MAKHYDSFDELQKSVQETYNSFVTLIEKFDYDFLSKEGGLMYDVYYLLDDAFNGSCDKEDLVKAVAGEITTLKAHIKHHREANTPADLEEAEELNETIKYLVKYIRFNCEESLWESYTEFDHTHKTHGAA